VRLSHSASQKYQGCAYQYKLHYIDRLRSAYIGSALIFGTALDDAFSRLLLEKKRTLSDADRLLMVPTAKETFLSSMSKTFLNNGYLDVDKSSQIKYFKSDCDVSLLSDTNRQQVSDHAGEMGFDVDPDNIEQFVEEFRAIKYPENENEISVYNYICWLSLVKKGLLLIDSYVENVIPKIHEVFDIQKEICLPDEDGNGVIGYIDIIASFTDEPDKVYIVDNKTSSSKYPENAVLESEQLATYCEHEQVFDAAYIVVEKKLRKRDPRTRIQIIRDVMPEEQIDNTFDKLTEVFHNINEGKFEQNWDSCFQFGQPCPYYKYCRGGDLKGLVSCKKKK